MYKYIKLINLNSEESINGGIDSLNINIINQKCLDLRDKISLSGLVKFHEFKDVKLALTKKS